MINCISCCFIDCYVKAYQTCGIEINLYVGFHGTENVSTFALRNQRRPPAKKLTLTISFARRSTQKSEISKAILMN